LYVAIPIDGKSFCTANDPTPRTKRTNDDLQPTLQFMEGSQRLECLLIKSRDHVANTLTRNLNGNNDERC